MLTLSGRDGDEFFVTHGRETLRVVLIDAAKGKLGFEGSRAFDVERGKVRAARLEREAAGTIRGEAA